VCERPVNVEAAGIAVQREHLVLGDAFSYMPQRGCAPVGNYPQSVEVKTTHHMQTTFTLG
jgi:hypothetical protein